MSNEAQGAAPANAEAVELVDVREYWRMLVRRRLVAATVFAAVLAAGLIYLLVKPRLYESTCSIIIDLTAPKVLDSQAVQDVVDSGTGSFWFSKEYYETQYKVIGSRAVAKRVVEKLELARDDSFLGIDHVRNPEERDRRRAAADPAAVLLSRLKLQPVKDSRVVRLTVEDRKPTRAALIANAIADAYIVESLSIKSAATQNAAEWLEIQLAELGKKLADSGNALFEFKKQNDIVFASWEDRQSMVSQRLVATNDALAKVRVQKAQLKARAAGVQEALTALEGERHDTGPLEALPNVIANGVVNQLKMKYIEVEAECDQVNLRYLEKHPRTESCASRQQLAHDALLRELRTVAGAVQREYRDVEHTEANLAQLYERSKGEAFNLNQHEREYVELRRAYENNQRLYDLVLKRLKDTGVTGVLQVSNVRILDRALPSDRPAQPRTKRVLAVALLLACLGALAAAFGAERLDNSIRLQEHVEERVGLTLLGVVPALHRDALRKELVVFEEPRSSVAEALRTIRANLFFMSPERPLRKLLVTSGGPQEGKTTTACAIAATLAEAGKRVVLVDADMRRARLHKVFEADSRGGLSSAILGETPLEDAVKATRVPNLSVLPCGPIPPNPTELLHTQAFSVILDSLSKAYDTVIIDSPPLGPVADAMVIGPQVDGTVMIVRASKTTRDSARRAVRMLSDVNAPVLGAILNDFDVQRHGYGGYYYAPYNTAEEPQQQG